MSGIPKKITWEENENGCYVCTSHSRTQDGYARYYRCQKQTRVHVHIYEQMFGDIPKGMVVRHKCDNPNCINPEHLELGTVKDNMNDMVLRGRSLKGTKNKSSKLTEEIVLEIKKKLYNNSLSELARFYNVSVCTISDIKQGRSWGWL